jgi:hypothetical protein
MEWILIGMLVANITSAIISHFGETQDLLAQEGELGEQREALEEIQEEEDELREMQIDEAIEQRRAQQEEFRRSETQATVEGRQQAGNIEAQVAAAGLSNQSILAAQESEFQRYMSQIDAVRSEAFRAASAQIAAMEQQDEIAELAAEEELRRLEAQQTYLEDYRRSPLRIAGTALEIGGDILNFASGWANAKTDGLIGTPDPKVPGTIAPVVADPRISGLGGGIGSQQ